MTTLTKEKTRKPRKKAAKKVEAKVSTGKRNRGKVVSKPVVTTTPDPGDEDLERTPLTGDNGGR